MRREKEKHACKDTKSFKIIERWSVSNGSEFKYSWGLMWIQPLFFFPSNLIIAMYRYDQWNSRSNDRHLSPLLAQHCNQCLLSGERGSWHCWAGHGPPHHFRKTPFIRGSKALICKGLRIKNTKHRKFSFFKNYVLSLPSKKTSTITNHGFWIICA